MTPDQKFKTFIKTYLNEYYDLYPASASSLGLHEYDGKLSDISSHGIEKQINFYKSYQEKLKDFNYEELNDSNKFDYELLKWQCDSYVFEIEEMQPHKKNPMMIAYHFYVLNSYINREYAPFKKRFKSIVSVASQIPQALKNSKGSLNKNQSIVVCKYASSFLLGYIKYFNEQVPSLVKQNEVEESDWDNYNIAKEEAITAIKEFVDFLNNEISQDNESHRLGKELFMRMLKKNEQIDIAFEDLKKMGEDELDRLNSEVNDLASGKSFKSILEEHEKEHPSSETLMQETRDMLGGLVQFIKDKNIVRLPEKLNCIVTEMPSYMDFGFAAMGTAGPFEKSDESYYYINLPKEEWDDKKKEEWLQLFNYPVLKMISIHEAYPGHYTHFINANEFSTNLAKTVMSYSYVEGWAHYTEEMMLEQGYDKDNHGLKLGYLKEALIRCCRFLTAIGVHCEGWTIDEGKKFFMENAFMNETTAEQEAERAAFDPGYLNYTLGKIILKQLRREFISTYGDDSLREFHDRLVSLGAPTWQIARKYILNNSTIFV